jgi:hypothetical protein
MVEKILFETLILRGYRPSKINDLIVSLSIPQVPINLIAPCRLRWLNGKVRG